MNGHEESSGRETRLLLLVIVVALVVLVVLARFRFPATELASVTPGPGPLERLAQRASYDDLGRTIAGVVDRLEPSVDIVELQPDPDRTRRGAPPAPAVKIAAAVRMRPDIALVYVPDGYRVGLSQGMSVIALDEVKRLALVRIPSSPDGAAVKPGPAPNFTYVAVVEAAVGGPTARPLFLGRVDEESDPNWPGAILVPGGEVSVAIGAWLFDLDGHLIGLVVPHGTGVGVVTQADLDAIVRSAGGVSPQEADGTPRA